MVAEADGLITGSWSRTVHWDRSKFNPTQSHVLYVHTLFIPSTQCCGTGGYLLHGSWGHLLHGSWGHLLHGSWGHLSDWSGNLHYTINNRKITQQLNLTYTQECTTMDYIITWLIIHMKCSESSCSHTENGMNMYVTNYKRTKWMKNLSLRGINVMKL